MNKFECDRNKARANFSKHQVRFTHAARALDSERTVTQRSLQRNEKGEERNLSITKLPNGRAIVIVWTPRGENVRLISVRRARKKEEEALNAYLKAPQ